ncbi:MAG: aminotransferase class V-fold PLP-dependent enzyme [Flavobacteriales bacterium]|nr:aminotransferase class V-fold PLP-dependent enzyme [Flavobacteriales bacterium]
MTERRDFLKKIGGATAALSLAPFFDPVYGRSLKEEVQKIAHLDAEQAAKEEDFWSFIQASYPVSANMTNLNNGGVSPQPTVVQEAFVRFNELSNEVPSYYMWRILDKGRETIRENLAKLAGCDKEEIAINRNSTEALETIIFGLNLESGDEVVVSKYDYPNMMNSWRQREKRDGVVLKYVELDMPMEDDKEIVKRYTDQMTSKTKIVHITQVINWTGQILPVKKITEAAHKKGAEVIVDGAHAYAHIDFSLRDFNCDYFGTSLHKWLCAPFGTGFMFVKKEKISSMWTMFSNDDPNSDDIRKFESLGTRSFPGEQAIGNALKFHNMVGTRRKEERLRYLKNYWVDQVKDLPKVKLYTSQLPQYSCALTTFGIEGKTGQEINLYLFTNFKIHCTGIEKVAVNGVRVTPHIYTTLAELDRLVTAIKELAV